MDHRPEPPLLGLPDVRALGGKVGLGPAEGRQVVEGGSADGEEALLLEEPPRGELHVGGAVAAVAEGAEGVGAVGGVEVVAGGDGVLGGVGRAALGAARERVFLLGERRRGERI